MKKTLKRMCAVLFTALLLTAAVQLPAFAEDGTALKLDAANRYAGMAKSYSQGYIPTVSGNAVTVVLPLVLDGQSGVRSVKNNTITVVPDFGTTANSPFVISNLETTFKLAAHPVSSTKKAVKGWLVSLTLPLSPYRVNGVYPLALKVKYASGRMTYSQTFTVFVTVSDATGPAPKPRVIVKEYAVSPATVTAGEGFTLSFGLENTDQVTPVRNVKVTLKGENGDLIPNAGEETQYLPLLGPGETKQLTARMTARFDAEAKPQKVTAAIEYEDAGGAAYSVSSDMVVQVTQPVRLEFDKPNIPSTINAGDTISVSLGVFNLGRNKLSNVMCKVAAPGLLPEGSAFLGNMDAGAAKTAEIYVYVGTLDMSLDADGNIAKDASVTGYYGATSGFINVTYEDEFGHKLSRQVKLETTIAEPVAPAPTSASEAPKTETGQWWISVVVAGAVAVVLGVAMLLLKRKRMKEVSGEHEAD